MAFNGQGQFIRLFNWTADKLNGIKIVSARMDGEDNNFAAGLSNTICKDGQQTTIARIPFAQGISINPGALATPGLTVINDPTTGIFQSGAGLLDFVSEGVRMAGMTATGFSATTLTVTGAATINGSAPIVRINTRVMVASATYTPSTGMLFALVQGVGGGGGGGGTGASLSGAGAGGGGSQGFQKLLTAAQIGTQAAITIGIGGAAGTGSTNGGTGGFTTFVPNGTFTQGLVAYAGTGGQVGPGATGNSVTLGGSPTASGGGDFNLSATSGGPGIFISGSQAVSGAGGSSAFGFGGLPVSGNNPGYAGSGYGSGGSGGAESASGTQAGGAGASGVVIITEYCSQ